MKKLMMAVAAVFAVASIASATTIKWGDRAMNKDGDPLSSGGTAYLVYLGDNGTLDATFANGAWSMGDDVIAGSAQIASAADFPSTSSSWGYYNASTEVSYPTGSKYAVIVTDKGIPGSELPTDGYYGVSSGIYVQEATANGIIDTPTDTFGVTAASIPVDVPEPTTYALIGIAAAALALRKRFLKK